MGIDRIGKGGTPPAAPETSGVEKRSPTEKVFSAERPDATRAAQGTESVAASTALARLRAGEIDVNQYVDIKVDEATRGLGLERLSPAELDDIKKVLRDQVATDPALTDLVRQATGKTPDVPEE